MAAPTMRAASAGRSAPRPRRRSRRCRSCRRARRCTATANRGLSAGAKAMNHACGCLRLRCRSARCRSCPRPVDAVDLRAGAGAAARRPGPSSLVTAGAVGGLHARLPRLRLDGLASALPSALVISCATCGSMITPPLPIARRDQRHLSGVVNTSPWPMPASAKRGLRRAPAAGPMLAAAPGVEVERRRDRCDVGTDPALVHDGHEVVAELVAEPRERRVARVDEALA